jgi:hypothetical protein
MTSAVSAAIYPRSNRNGAARHFRLRLRRFVVDTWSLASVSNSPPSSGIARCSAASASDLVPQRFLRPRPVAAGRRLAHDEQQRPERQRRRERRAPDDADLRGLRDVGVAETDSRTQ